MIKIKDLKYKNILKNINFNFEKGKFYGIIGPNGSGKTTFIETMSGYNCGKNLMGEILIKGERIESILGQKLSQRIAVVPQNFQTPFSFKVSNILEMGRYPYKKRLKGLGRDDLKVIDRVVNRLELENFLDTEIKNLSGGEKQRVIFGKALIQETEIIFLDESTSNLDPYHANSILEVVKDDVGKKETLAIGVFHDINLAIKYCDELILFSDGKIIEGGAVEEIIESKKLDEIFNIQWSRYKKGEEKFLIPKKIERK